MGKIRKIRRRKKKVSDAMSVGKDGQLVNPKWIEQLKNIHKAQK